MKPEDKEENKANEPDTAYGKRRLRIFNSFEEQEEYERMEMALLSPLERLIQLRKFINSAYGMYGYDPSKLPIKHHITFL